MSSASPLKPIRSTASYLIRSWVILVGSLLTYSLLRPWLIENTVNHYAIYAIWLATTVALIYAMSRQF